MAARTRADLSPDGKHYILNGQKMWITNGGAADFYTIFAKVDGEKFTAFLVERKFPGVSPGAEEKKMGIKGSSTTAIYLDNVPVPVENVLGEIGRGHIIAFNILNIGRLKLGAFACGGAKEVLRVSLKYAKERKAFGKSIAEFGLIQHKLAEMAIRIFATESATYRVVGLIESQLEGFSWDQPNAAQTELKAVEEFAAECSYIKIFASEMLDYVIDEGVQIHGGYGYHQDYAVERAYRDSRINRIFEGTNEINRLLATGMLLKRAQRGQLPLVEAVKKLQAEILAGPTSDRRQRRCAAGRKRQENRAVRARRRLSEIWRGARRAAGSSGVHYRYRDECFRHGIGLPAHAESWRICTKAKSRPTFAPCFCAKPWRSSKAPRATCWRPARKATLCGRISRCSSASPNSSPSTRSPRAAGSPSGF